jgi:hypothetical protein
MILILFITVVPELYLRGNISATNVKGLSQPNNRLRAEYSHVPVINVGERGTKQVRGKRWKEERRGEGTL